MSTPSDKTRRPLIVTPGEGRKYDMGRMRAVFFADADDTETRYSISEWWLEPRTPGPGVHSHSDDHIFCVLSGTLSLLIDGVRTDAPRGSYALIPGGVPHDFQNHGAEECGFICINAPAGFEEKMPGIVEWFAENPLREMGRG